MGYTSDTVPNCVPEYYREQEEERGRRFDLAMQRRAHYLENRRKLDEAVRAGLPILDFGGYGSCGGCPKADDDTATDDEDDIGRVICGDPACPEHMKHQDKEADEE